MQSDARLEHPDVAWAERTGYPRSLAPAESAPVCNACGEEISPNSIYAAGESTGNICAACEDELVSAFKALTFTEKAVALGMDVKYCG